MKGMSEMSATHCEIKGDFYLQMSGPESAGYYDSVVLPPTWKEKETQNLG